MWLCVAQGYTADHAGSIAYEHRVVRHFIGFDRIRLIGIRKRLVIAIGGAIETEHVAAGLLKLQLKEKSVGDIDALSVDAVLVVVALGDLAGPVVEPAAVRLARQEIVIGLRHENLRVIDWL